MENKEKEDMLKQRAFEFEVLRERAQTLEDQILNLEMKRNELEIVSGSLDEIKDKKDKEILVPLGSGVFLRGKLLESEKVLINVGANVIVEKSLEEAKNIITSQIEEIEKIEMQVKDEFTKYLVAMQKIQEEFEALQK
ncbi:MAG: prefoldin subunit alpha [Candidatus Parvarchaeota archaeon]|nr:prefoldin subunit alpha [Candidatus Jingweiarchaeum tengchongense]MCW1298228.1 prefoldin subunit alpha [Candidatus Jingweiarchaeum tengchongense]MCW1300026.1 prefoldin subunit alpha [Candidatus Jingweiarchaeum tengchongense]MCW1304835.1 prefoldin subunit alpha [Candidatus Jingweiarchaeum tengchongense]MCW1305425.1 prefoldin subunit alpha [Candidatus Jingweiarchaeum tengchongense]